MDFNNIPNDTAKPGVVIEFDASMAKLAVYSKRTLIIGQMTKGKGEANKLTYIGSSSVAKDMFGRGSQLAKMVELYKKNDPQGELYCIALPDPTSGKQASGTIKVTGQATGAGVVNVYVSGQRVQAVVASGDNATKVAETIANAIKAKPDLTVTAEAQAGTVTLNAKGKGVYGNDIKIEINRFGFSAGEELPEGIEVVATALSGGIGTLDFAPVVKAMGKEPADFVILGTNDKTHVDVFTEVMNNETGRWAWNKLIYGHTFTAKRGDPAQLKSYGNGYNDMHLTVFGVPPKMPSAEWELASAYVGAIAQSLRNTPARPVQTLGIKGVVPFLDGEDFDADGDDGDSAEMLLKNGISLMSKVNGAMSVLSAITTRTRDERGDPDYCCRNVEIMFTNVEFQRCIYSELGLFARMALASDGTPLDAGLAVTTPNEIRTFVIEVYAKLCRRGLCEDLETFAKTIVVERSKDNPDRINILMHPNFVNQLKVIAIRNQFVL